MYKSLKIEGQKAIISYFNSKSGLISKSKELSLFEIAGIDKQFYPAKAIINTDGTTSVWSDKVAKPVAVRYAFKDYVVGDLFNAAGLPAPTFRTDNWK